MCRAWFARSFIYHGNNIVDVWRSFHPKLWWQWWCQWEYYCLSPSIFILITVITSACDCIYEREQIEVSDTLRNYCIAFIANRFVVLSSSWASATAIYTCVHTVSCFLKLFVTVHVFDAQKEIIQTILLYPTKKLLQRWHFTITRLYSQFSQRHGILYTFESFREKV